MTIVTSNIAYPGTYYGEITNHDDISFGIRFSIEVRKNKGLRFYFEDKDDIVSSKFFEDEDLSWKSKSKEYSTKVLSLGDKKIRINYIPKTKNFQVSWHCEDSSIVASGVSSKRFALSSKSGTALSPPKVKSGGGSKIFSYIFHSIFFIAVLVLLYFVFINVKKRAEEYLYSSH